MKTTLVIFKNENPSTNSGQGVNNNDTQHMTSLEIAELTGKPHNDVLKAIRKMEPAWEKVCQGKFSLTSRIIEQPNGGTREVPCYSLTKTECLYIATKFNDEARAKLVIRWEELESEKLKVKSEKFCLPEPKKILQLADEIIGTAFSAINSDAEDTLTATQVAKTFNMTVSDFNAVLCNMGIQYRRYGRLYLASVQTLRTGRMERVAATIAIPTQTPRVPACRRSSKTRHKLLHKGKPQSPRRGV